jgi:thioredoxin-related protein
MKNMKVLFAAIFACLSISIQVSAQAGKVPPFRMIQGNGTLFRAQDLPVGKPIIIFYFSPECEDCHKLTNEILSRINDLRGVSIAMITYQSVENVRKYVIDYRLSSYNNIFVGTEGSSLFVRNYYNITKFPFLVLFDKNGNQVVKYPENQVNTDDLCRRVKLLVK